MASWKTLGFLTSSLSKVKPVLSQKMRKPNLSLAETAYENAEVFVKHFESSVFGRQLDRDPSVVESPPQEDIDKSLGEKLSLSEVDTAMKKLRYTVGPYCSWKI